MKLSNVLFAAFATLSAGLASADQTVVAGSGETISVVCSGNGGGSSRDFVCTCRDETLSNGINIVWATQVSSSSGVELGRLQRFGTATSSAEQDWRDCSNYIQTSPICSR